MDYQFLSQTMLFSGESPEEIKEMLSCLGAVTRSYGKGEIIYHAGECVHSMGLCSPEMFRLKVMMSGEITVY